MNKSSLHLFIYFIIILSSFILTDLFYYSSKNNVIGGVDGATAIYLTSNEHECLTNLINKFNLTKTFPKNSSDLYDLQCAKNYDISFISCHRNRSISKLGIYKFDNGVPTSVQLLNSDLRCFQYASELVVSLPSVSEEVLYTKIHSLVSSFTVIDFLFKDNAISKKLAPYDSMTIRSTSLDGSILKMSYFYHIRSFNIDSPVILDADTPNTAERTILKVLIVNCLNLPNLSGFKFDRFILKFALGYSTTDLTTNFKYIEGESVALTFPDNVIGLKEIPFYFGNNKNIKYLSHTGDFVAPTQIYDLTTTNYQNIALFSPKDSLFFNNQIALVVNNNTSILFKPSLLDQSAFSIQFPTLNVFNGRLKYYEFQKSAISSSLPKYSSLYSSYAYDLSNNRITGTIDSSWCGTNLIVANNQLAGTIPSCFTCHFSNGKFIVFIIDPYNNVTLPSMSLRFAGNQFTNYNSPPPCTTMKPRVSYHNKTTLIISGEDIGFDLGNFFVNSTIMCDTRDLMGSIIRMGFEYYCVISSTPVSFDQVHYLSMLFYYQDKVVYTFPLINNAPIITSASISISDNGSIIFILVGSYFSSYPGYSTQSIQILNNNCTISSTSFHVIKCTVIEPLPTTSYSKLITIKVENETSLVLVNTTVGSLNNKVCSTKCSSSLVCDLSVGQCRPFCPNNCTSSINGYCIDEINGICQCNLDYYGDSCAFKPCEDPTCSNNGICNLYGQCECNSRYEGESCEFKQCITPDCNNNGICNKNNGICGCDQDYFGDSCEFKQCKDPTCSNNGICNGINGVCDCRREWFGQNCSIPIHYVTSVIPSDENGGNATFYGYFGSTHQTPLVTIGSNDCSVLEVSSQAIVCFAPPGKGTHNYNITQNGLSKIGINLYKYSTPPSSVENNSSTSYTCPNNCSNNGKCNSNGLCECYIGYALYDCSSLSNIGSNSSTSTSNSNPLPETKPNIDDETASVNLNNEQTNFKIYLKSLYEVDVNGNTIKEYPLTTDWTVNTSISNIYTFIQHPIQDNSNNFTIKSTIEIITSNEGKQFNFADTIFKLDKDSIKLTISIQNYPYQSYLNTLKLDIISNTSTTDQPLNNNNNQQCNIKDTKLETSTNNQLDLAFIKISKDNKVMMGRFINKVISDGRSTYLSTQTSTTSNNQSIIVTLNLPLCINECLIDPDFSVLVSSDYKSKCDDDSNNKWILPVAIVIPCFVLISIIIIGAIIYSRNKASLLAAKDNFVVKLNKIKRKNSIFMDHTRN